MGIKSITKFWRLWIFLDGVHCAFTKRFANFPNKIIMGNCTSWGNTARNFQKTNFAQTFIGAFSQVWGKLFDRWKILEYAADNNHYALITLVYEVIARNEEHTIGGQAGYPPTRSLLESLKKHFHGNLSKLSKTSTIMLFNHPRFYSPSQTKLKIISSNFGMR